MKRYIRSSSVNIEPLAGQIVFGRLISNCHWSPDTARYAIDTNLTYTLDELSDILAEECRSSGEFDSADDAIEWGNACAKAVFNNTDVGE